MSRPFIARGEHAAQTIAQAGRYAMELVCQDEAAKITVDVLKPTRTLEQNSLLWSVLTDIARQVPWHVDGKEQHLEPDDWKDILSAGLKKHQRVAAGIEGGFVMLGQRTSKMTIAQMSELIEFAHWFGADKGVKWSPTSIGRDQTP